MEGETESYLEADGRSVAGMDDGGWSSDRTERKKRRHVHEPSAVGERRTGDGPQPDLSRLRAIDCGYGKREGGYVFVWAYLPSGPRLYKGSCKRVSDVLKVLPRHHIWSVVYQQGPSKGRYEIRGVGSAGWYFRKRASGVYLFKGDEVVAVFNNVPRKYIHEFGHS